MRSTVQAMPHGLRFVPAPRQLDVGLSGDSPAGLDRAAMRQATAHWTEGWYRAVTGTDGDIRTSWCGARRRAGPRVGPVPSWPGTTRAAMGRWRQTGPQTIVMQTLHGMTRAPCSCAPDPGVASAVRPASAALRCSGEPAYRAARRWPAPRHGHERGEARVAERWATMALPGSTSGRHTRQAVSHTVVFATQLCLTNEGFGTPAAHHYWPISGTAIGPDGAERGGALAADIRARTGGRA